MVPGLGETGPMSSLDGTGVRKAQVSDQGPQELWSGSTGWAALVTRTRQTYSVSGSMPYQEGAAGIGKLELILFTKRTSPDSFPRGQIIISYIVLPAGGVQLRVGAIAGATVP